MFQDCAEPKVLHFPRAFVDIHSAAFPSKRASIWTGLEGDPLSREKLEFQISATIQLMLRYEAGDAGAREALQLNEAYVQGW